MDRPRKRRRSVSEPNAVPDLSSFSIHAIKVELYRRAEPTTGLRAELETRLRRALSTSSSTLSVPKQFPVFSPFASIPVESGNSSTVQPPVPAILRGRSVWVCTDKDVAAAWTRTSCGKANLSRSAPSYHALAHPQHANWKGRAMRQLLMLQLDGSQDDRADVEHLQLTLVEAFYSAFVTKHILISDQCGRPLTDIDDTWNLFCKQCDRFPLTFVAYSRYRATGWLPKSGLKYGVNWVLYPFKRYAHTHAPYCIILQFSDSTRDVLLERSWIAVQNRLRLVKNVAKTLVIARIHAEKVDFSSSISNTFSSVKVSELTVDRWLP